MNISNCKNFFSDIFEHLFLRFFFFLFYIVGLSPKIKINRSFLFRFKRGCVPQSCKFASKPLKRQRPEVSEVAGTDDEQVSDEEAPADNVNKMPVQVKHTCRMLFWRREPSYLEATLALTATLYVLFRSLFFILYHFCANF